MGRQPNLKSPKAASDPGVEPRAQRKHYPITGYYVNLRIKSSKM